MTLPNGMYPATPPPVSTSERGKKPSLLTNEVAQVLLGNPNTWYVIGKSDKWISGVKPVSYTHLRLPTIAKV